MEAVMTKKPTNPELQEALDLIKKEPEYIENWVKNATNTDIIKTYQRLNEAKAMRDVAFKLIAKPIKWAFTIAAIGTGYFAIKNGMQAYDTQKLSDIPYLSGPLSLYCALNSAKMIHKMDIKKIPDQYNKKHELYRAAAKKRGIGLN